MESWNFETNAEHGSECEPQEDIKEDKVDKGGLQDDQAIVSWFEHEHQTNREVTLLVSNLAPQVNEDILYDIYTKYGTISHHSIIRNRGVSRGISRGYGFISFMHPEQAAQALHHTKGLKLYNKTIKVTKTTARQKLKSLMYPVEMMPGVHPYEEVTAVTVNVARSSGKTDNVISSKLANSLRCLVVETQDPEETVEITENNSTISLKITGATMMYIRYRSTPGHNKKDGILPFSPIAIKVSTALDAGKFQCVLNTSTLENLKLLPPSQEKSSDETKQATKRLRKQLRDIIRRQEVFRIKKLHENIEKNRKHTGDDDY